MASLKRKALIQHLRAGLTEKRRNRQFVVTLIRKKGVRSRTVSTGINV